MGNLSCLLTQASFTNFTLEYIVDIGPFPAYFSGYGLYKVTLETTARADAVEDIEERQAFVETYLLNFSFFLVF